MKKPLLIALSSFFLVLSIFSDVGAENMYYKIATNLYKKNNIDTGNGTIIANIGSNGTSLSIDKDGQYIYTTAQNGNIIKINTTDGQYTTWMEGISSAQYISYINGVEYLYYVDSLDGQKIKRQKTDKSDQIKVFPITGLRPFAVTSDETFYFPDSSNSDFLYKYNESSGKTQLLAMGVYKVYIKDSNTIYYVPFVDSRVKSLDLNTLAVTDLGTDIGYYFDLSKDGRYIIYSNANDSERQYKKEIGTQGVGNVIVTDTSTVLTAVDRGYTPPTVPNQASIQGLECVIVRQPIISLTQWYTSYGSLSERIVTTGGGNIIQTGSGAGGLNFDAFAIIGSNSGATLPIGSITYTGSTYADIGEFSIGGQPSTLYGYVKRDGAFAGWNVLQINGVNTSGFFGKYGILRGIDGTMKDRIVYSSGSTATAYLENGRVGSTWNIFSPISGFSGVRVGYAPYGDYRSCSKKGINSCEWRIEGGSNVCAPKIADGFEVGICGITGSGSVYGSGSCVPITGSGGDILDAGILPGQGMVVTLPDGTTKLVRIPEGYNSKVFTCPNSRDEPWYRYIFTCGGEVIGNILDAVTGESQELIYSQIGTFSNERVYQGSFSGLLENIKSRANPLVGSGALSSDDTLILALKGKLDTIGDPGPNIWERMFTGTFALFSLLVILSIIGFIIRAFRQDMDDIQPPQNRS